MTQPAVIKVLLVEDSHDDAILVREILAKSDGDRFHVIRVTGLEEAGWRLAKETFDVMFLDLTLPEGTGLAALAAAQSIAPPDMPIITLPGHRDEAIALQALELGAQDYLVKYPGNSIGLSRIRRAIERTRVQTLADSAARYDATTGLPNREHFRRMLNAALSDAEAGHGTFTLILMDLDRFKSINASLGYGAGDQLLKAVAERLKHATGSDTTVARIGGDEFAVLIRGISNPEETGMRAQALLDLMAPPFNLGGHEVFITPSIGITHYPNAGGNADEFIRHAEQAMYRAKQQGRNNYQFFEPDMAPPAMERLRLENGLRRALKDEQFVLYYQPQVDLATGQITGVEALLRWHHPQLGVISPGQFIWLAEETGLIVPIGEWVLRTACRQARAWRDAGMPPKRMVVNLSARQFRQEGLLDMVRSALNDSGLEPEYLTLEITEGTLVENTKKNGQIISELKAMGIRLSIDDFGMGYSSLSYLKRFPVDVLKLDRAFVKDVTTDAGDAAIARAIIALAKGLSITVIAEGVETRAQLKFLRDEGCHSIQGFLFSRPIPPKNLSKLVAASPELPA